MFISLQQIHQLANPGIVEEGRQLFHEGRVTLTMVEDDHITAVVEEDEELAVELMGEGDSLRGVCTCAEAVERNCPHVVSVMLAVIYHNARISYKPREFPINIRRARRPRRRVKSSIDQIRKIIPEPIAEEFQTSQAMLWRIAYGIALTDEHVDIFPIRLRVRKDGGISQVTRLKDFSLDDTDHLDFRDRLLLPLLSSLGSQSDFASYLGTSFNRPSVVRSWPNRELRLNDILLLLPFKEVYLEHNGNLTASSLEISSEPVRFFLNIEEKNDGLHLEPLLKNGESTHPVPRDLTILTFQPLWVLDQNKLFRIEGITGKEFASVLRFPEPCKVVRKETKIFMTDLLPKMISHYDVRANISGLDRVDEPPVPRLYLREIKGKLVGELKFGYSTVELAARERDASRRILGDPEVVSGEKGFVLVLRNNEEENRWLDLILKFHIESQPGTEPYSHLVPTVSPFEWIFRELPRIREAGVHVFGEEGLKRHRLRSHDPVFGLRVSSGIDWLDLKLNVTFSGRKAGTASIADAVHKGEKFVKLDDGSFGILPDHLLNRLQRILSIGGRGQEGLRLSKMHIGAIEDLLEVAEQAECDVEFEKIRKRLRSFAEIRERKVPAKFRGVLRPYQESGFHWLHFLREFQVGGILADDMGLGKTIQTLVMLQDVYLNGENLPSLVVVPTSPLFNWKTEIDRFTPDLKALLYIGPNRKQLRDSFETSQIIITSYGILRRDIAFLKERSFLYLVLDESQNIKNASSMNARSARQIKARHRLALSGTPVENNLMELWSQFAFLNPGMLGRERTFAEYFARPIEKYQDDGAAESLRRMIYPFMLRRTKEQVAPDLPPKVESTVYCEMEPEQRSAYDHWREHFRREVIQTIDEVGFQKSRMKVLEALLRLRQICCHPSLVDSAYHGSAGKMEAFIEMVDDVLAEGHKVLVFSQFVQMLSILREHFNRRGISYEYLDGSTTNRKERVTRFQTDDSLKLFLISLKAGGTGLNLTAADYVIHYDPWWNPAVEMQATDRTHRIGQTKQVFSYKLITRESVEEKVLLLQERKRDLVKNVVTTESGFFKSLSQEDIEGLFE